MPVKIFLCFAFEDDPLLNKLKTHLKPLQRQGLIDVHCSGDIPAGSEWERKIDEFLSSADLILLLASPDFMDSDECVKQMNSAIASTEYGLVGDIVICVLLRPVDWLTTDLRLLPVLPSNKIPVTSWANQDEAFHDIALGIKKLVIDACIKQYLDEGNDLCKQYNFQKALSVYEAAIRMVEAPENIALKIACPEDPYIGKGKALYAHNRYGEALRTFGQAIKRNPQSAKAHIGKGNVLYRLNRYTEALSAYDTAIQLDPSSASAFMGKADTLSRLNRNQEARGCYAEVLYHGRYSSICLTMRSEALYRLGCNEEALLPCEKALQINPRNAEAHNWKGNILYSIPYYPRRKGGSDEALAAFETAIQLNPYYLAPRYNKARLLASFPQQEEALAIYQEIIELDSGYILAIEGRASVLKALKKYEQALADFKYANELCPQDTTNLRNIIEILQILGKSEEAKEYETLLSDEDEEVFPLLNQ